MKILSNREGVEGREVKMILRNGEGGGGWGRGVADAKNLSME